MLGYFSRTLGVGGTKGTCLRILSRLLKSVFRVVYPYRPTYSLPADTSMFYLPEALSRSLF